jgi:hypothetical protein
MAFNAVKRHSIIRSNTPNTEICGVDRAPSRREYTSEANARRGAASRVVQVCSEALGEQLDGQICCIRRLISKEILKASTADGSKSIHFCVPRSHKIKIGHWAGPLFRANIVCWCRQNFSDGLLRKLSWTPPAFRILAFMDLKNAFLCSIRMGIA